MEDILDIPEFLSRGGITVFISTILSTSNKMNLTITRTDSSELIHCEKKAITLLSIKQY